MLDYNEGPKTVTLSTGLSSKSLSIPIINDDIVECPESFYVELLGLSICGYTIGSSRNARVTIRDDDGKWMLRTYILTYFSNYIKHLATVVRSYSVVIYIKQHILISK